MTNHQVATTLFNIATILEAYRADPYRVRAYRRAAVMILRLDWELEPWVKRGVFPKIPHIGKRLTQKIGELIRQGQMTFYDELCSSLPGAHRELMRVPGVGPRTAARLADELRVNTPAELLAAARAGRVRQLPRFGEKSERNLAAAAARLLAPEPPEGTLPPFSPGEQPTAVYHPEDLS